MNYSLIPAPAAVHCDDFNHWQARSLVDYERHPAYSPLIASASFAQRTLALWRFARAFTLIKVKRAIRYEMIPLHVRKGSLAGFAAAALGNLLQPSKPRRRDTDSHSLTPLDQSFRRQGVAALSMPAAAFAKLDELSRPNFADLEARRSASAGMTRDFEASRSYARRDQAAALFDAIEQVFTESGVMATATAYLGRPARLVDVNPQINDRSDDFWRRIFPDLPDAPHPKSAYFHRDASGGDLKVIVYMSDVGPQQGPFCYVLGSHRMPLNTRDDHIAEAIDSNGMAGTGPVNRRDFAALPAALRQKGSFGNDVPDDSALGQAIQNSLWSITAQRGSIVMFDTKGIHRGGMVAEGQRRVITCVLG